MAYWSARTSYAGGLNMVKKIIKQFGVDQTLQMPQEIAY
jgi:hypothetical protein